MIEIPVVRDGAGRVRPAFTVVVDLLSTPFALSFRWNARAACWVFAMAPADGDTLVAGLAVRVGSPIYSFLRAGFPLGIFVAIDTSSQQADPGRDDLGDRVRVYFLEPGDL